MVRRRIKLLQVKQTVAARKIQRFAKWIINIKQIQEQKAKISSLNGLIKLIIELEAEGKYCSALDVKMYIVNNMSTAKVTKKKNIPLTQPTFGRQVIYYLFYYLKLKT